MILVENQFYIQATSPLADDRTRVLKHNETFAVFNRYGDILPTGHSQHGIYHEGTRFLSRFGFYLDRHRPLLLSSALTEDNLLLTVDLTNFDVKLDGRVIEPRGTLHIHRSKLLWEAVCYELVRFRNYGLIRLDAELTLRFDADFADIFEVRGASRERKGCRLQDCVEDGAVILPYQGLDGVLRRTRIEAAPRAQQIAPGEMTFALHLEPQEEAELSLTVSCEVDTRSPRRRTFERALSEETEALLSLRSHECTIHTNNEQFCDWLDRCAADLHMMITHTHSMLYPYAGVPWYSAPFGRDGIITALEVLWVNPRIARGVLAFLSATQARDVNPAQDAEPGKILHEQRDGEMAALGEHPFRCYYGSVDATPLFVMLAGEYYQRTGDHDFIRSIWPNIDMALRWIEDYGDQDGDGFVEYSRRSSNGLVQQGWKDSHDSVFHEDGSIAEPPIALCEVQGYVYAAKLRGAEIAVMLGYPERAERLAAQARQLQEEFDRAFWSEELSSYVLALDGEKRPCRVRTSNAGHCLFAGIATPEHGMRTAETLLSDDLFSGWGIRTVSASEVRYNPISYHNGSVWPHDNAIIACGLGRYGRRDLVTKVLAGLFDAALFLDQRRLPELLCGFRRRPGEGPTRYPVACSPQAWASGAVFMLIQASLGLSIHAVEKKICLTYPCLPEFVPEIRLKNLRVGDASVDLRLERQPYGVGTTVLRRDGLVDIVSIK
jgi:glycogen debranching enzyme